MREEKNIEIYRDIIVDFFNSRLNLIVIYVYGSILGCAFNEEREIVIRAKYGEGAWMLL
jgi:hypothetical protein